MRIHFFKIYFLDSLINKVLKRTAFICKIHFVLQYTMIFKFRVGTLFNFFKKCIFLFRSYVLESHNKDLYC